MLIQGAIRGHPRDVTMILGGSQGSMDFNGITASHERRWLSEVCRPVLLVALFMRWDGALRLLGAERDLQL